MDKSKEVTIIGAGLVGSLTAIFLAKRGYKVVVFEQLPDVRKESIAAGRSINLALANRGIRPLQDVGIMDKVEKLLIPMKGRMLHDVEGNLQFQAYGQRENEVIYSVSRVGLVSLLRDEAEATGNVQFKFKQKLTQINFDESTLSIEDGDSEIQYTHEYNLLLASDGAGSRVRRELERSGAKGFSSELLTHSYKELEIPAGKDNSFQIDKNSLHIWPRGEYMLIALPNLDGSFTVTLFMPNSGNPSFETIQNESELSKFFDEKFKDAQELIPDLKQEYFDNPTGIMGTVRCDKWDFNNVLLIGDSSHAIVPFHGQGMNAGFEDCGELNRLLGKFDDDWDKVLPEFSKIRKPNTDAIADMALENYIEMRDSVRDPQFHLKKAIAFELEQRFPEYFIPRYSMVMFHHIPYAEAQLRGETQAEILNDLVKNIDSTDEIDFEQIETVIKSKLGKIILEAK